MAITSHPKTGWPIIHTKKEEVLLFDTLAPCLGSARAINSTALLHSRISHHSSTDCLIIAQASSSVPIAFGFWRSSKSLRVGAAASLPHPPRNKSILSLLYACTNAQANTTPTTHIHLPTQTQCRAWLYHAHVRTWLRASRPTSFLQPPPSLLLLLLLRPLPPRPPTTPPPPPSCWNPDHKNAGQWTRWSRSAHKP